MTELPKEPSIQDLLARIVALETENAKLATRIELREKSAATFSEHLLRLTKQVGGILNDLHTIDPQLFHLMEKNFPGHARTQLQIGEIFDPVGKVSPSQKD
jgi:hypothetical protein